MWRQVFAQSGVDVPMKHIADVAGVGVGTLYRHFPTRADLIKAYPVDEIDAHANAAETLLASLEPGVALSQWVIAYTNLLASKPRLAPALHSGDPAFDGLRDYFWQRLGPALTSLLKAAAANGEIRSDIDARDILTAISDLTHTAAGMDTAYNHRMVALLIDGLYRRRQA